MTLFDTHCHLDDPRLAEELPEVLARAKDAGVGRMATIGCARSVEDARSALEVARTHPDTLVATVGVHPHDASAYDDALEAAVHAVGDEDDIVAIGEMGLDYHYDSSPREQQRDAFRRQVAIAKELRKPIVVHTRNAPEDTLAILREEGAKDVGGIIHCFTEDAGFAKAALDLGFVASFSGIVTFKNARAIQDAARAQPLDALLIETDAPYLAPIPHRGKRNEPAYVAHTAHKVAELRGEDPERLIEATYANALRIFGLEDRQPPTE